MNTRSLALLVLLVVSFATVALAGDLPRHSIGGDMIYGGSPDLAKAGTDTVNLMAAHQDPTNGPSEPAYFGDFQTAAGSPEWHGWTHNDITQPAESNWNVSNYQQPDPSNHAAWCGSLIFAACDTNDVVGGYGNTWHDLIEFRQTVPNPGINTTVTVTATLMHDTEPGYDFIHLSYRYHEQTIANLRSWEGNGIVAVNDSITFQPAEYLDGTDIAVYFRFRSDGGWSDEDCNFPSAGACQVDDINVHLVNGGFVGDYFEDFEHGGAPGDFGIWNIAFPDGVGDFAQIWTGLRDVDPCVSNTTPQVAFIDDGIVVPGTGGTMCQNWCYGPGGYIVNTTGGLAGPAEHLNNAIESPVMTWPANQTVTGLHYDGILLTFGVYRHEDLTADAPGIFYMWGVRSADTDNSAGNGFQDIADQPWEDRNFFYEGGPEYHRQMEYVTDLMNAGRDEVQIQLSVVEFGFQFGWTGNDGYPAPYFDNVTVKVYPQNGPAITARELDLAQDSFPQSGSLDTGNLGSNNVRFDMANNISSSWHMRNDPGDSVVTDIKALRKGAALVGDPELHYIMKPNPLFDPYRTSGMPAAGSVSGQPAVRFNTVYPNKWAFDLPDTGFLFPGDVLHYYISATDAIGGAGGIEPRTALVPADTTGFSTGFGQPLGYDSSFTVRALPGIRDDGFGGYDQPTVLFINDFGNRGGEDEWYTALKNIGLFNEIDYDVYYVNSPFAGAGNGIGGRANAGLLGGYEDILYTSGDLTVHTVANGDFDRDAGDDVGTLTGWLDQGNKDMFMSGDKLASDLGQSGSATWNFMENYLELSYQNNEIRSLIGNQASPLVVATPFPNPVFNGSLQSWIAYGGCEALSNIDAVETRGTATRLAEFTDPAGQPGAYSFSAGTLATAVGLQGTSRVISLPYDLMNILTDPAVPGHPLAGRTRLLRDVLLYFGEAGSGPSPVPASVVFQAKNFPNPFNPRTTFTYSLPRAGHLKLSVYNLRGQLVKTLIDGHRPAGADQTIVWDGTDNLGSAASSGLYFYEARSEGESKTGKMTLLR